MSYKRYLLSSALFVAGTLMVSAGITQNGAVLAKDAATKPRIDLAFCIDTTGSMQSEINAVKTKTKEIVAKLSGSKPAPDIRVGLVAYRDHGDAYVTKVFPFSDNIDQVVKDISSLEANGGGDAPEAVCEGLHSSVNDLKWSNDKKTVKMLFLIGDAGPHQNDNSWNQESKSAIAKGIQINTVACDGLNGTPEALNVFQQIAKLADGKCEFLTYRQEIVDQSGHKATMVSSAGKLYKLDSKSATAWKEGADKLLAKGMAAPVAASTVMPSAMSADYASSAGAMAMESAGATMRSRAVGFAKPSMMAAPRAAAPIYGGSLSRAENNLADIVLSATKDAAKKKANIEYKD